MTTVYGSCASALPLVMEELVAAVERFNEDYKARHGESAYEHFLYRVKGEESMREKCVRKGLSVTPRSALRMHQKALKTVYALLSERRAQQMK